MGINRRSDGSRLLSHLSRTSPLKYVTFQRKLRIALSYCEPYCSGFLVHTGSSPPLPPSQSTSTPFNLVPYPLLSNVALNLDLIWLLSLRLEIFQALVCSC